jgi:tRNA-specific 2-thiouridylase
MLTLGRTIAPGTRILVAMSGGVDSALTAVLLRRAGFEVVGINMRTYHPNEADLKSGRKFQSCCSPDDAADARAVAADGDFPFYVLDLEREFHTAVVQPFISEYLVGRTPNPCVLCNNHLKLGVLLDKAALWGCEYVATGHYAIVEENAVTGRVELRRAADRTKDQTYYLFGLTQDQLRRFVCPLGGLLKTEVRALAREHGLAVHDKPDSMEICFVPKNDYRQFLRERLGAGAIRAGDMVTTDGRVIGRHEGIAFYTIGQRRGLGVAGAQPMYVVDLLPQENLVVVGTHAETFARGLIFDRANWVAIPEPSGPIEAHIQIRYKSAPVPAVVTPLGDGQFEVVFASPQRAVTPGQAAVLYEGDTVLGGGWIKSRI